MTVSNELVTAYETAIAAQHGMSVTEYREWKDRTETEWMKKYPTLDVPYIPPKRRLNKPRLKLLYESRDDLWARIGGCYIFVGPKVFMVMDVREYKGEFWLTVADNLGKQYKLPYKESQNIDLRTPDPQYLNFSRGAYFVTRKPDRQWHQGFARSNMYCRAVGEQRFYRIEDQNELINSLADTNNLQWQTSFWELMSTTRAIRSLRLSPSIAFYKDKEERLVAEYRGRPLGYVRENCVELDERDYGKPWIKQDLHEIGCVSRKNEDGITPKVDLTGY